MAAGEKHLEDDSSFMCLFAEEARLRAEQEERERLERERKEKELAALEKNVILLSGIPVTVSN